LRPHDHVTPALKQIRWLPIMSRIVYIALSFDARTYDVMKEDSEYLSYLDTH